MNYPNKKSDGTPRLGRPPGPSRNRGHRPWDDFDMQALYTVAANPDMERYRIAEHLGMSASKLSNITNSPKGARVLAELVQLTSEQLSRFKIP
ncbi:MAG: hypothetical protein FJZ98_08580 [Chloroflexi bacterium]|nr:hypothetical protein [Chloroflexota bacterium]